MSEPKPIGIAIRVRLREEWEKNPFYFHKISGRFSYNAAGHFFLYDDGVIGDRSSDNYSNIIDWYDFAPNRFNQGQIHPDDWFWCNDDKRLKGMATLSDEDAFKIFMAGAVRITIPEYII